MKLFEPNVRKKCNDITLATKKFYFLNIFWGIMAWQKRPLKGFQTSTRNSFSFSIILFISAASQRNVSDNISLVSAPGACLSSSTCSRWTGPSGASLCWATHASDTSAPPTETWTSKHLKTTKINTVYLFFTSIISRPQKIYQVTLGRGPTPGLGTSELQGGGNCPFTFVLGLLFVQFYILLLQ